MDHVVCSYYISTQKKTALQIFVKPAQILCLLNSASDHELLFYGDHKHTCAIEYEYAELMSV